MEGDGDRFIAGEGEKILLNTAELAPHSEEIAIM